MTATAFDLVIAFSTVMCTAGLVHCAVNLRLLRRPSRSPAVVTEHVCVLIPARNEQSRIGRLLDSLREQTSLASWQVIVADDGSADRTAEMATARLEHMDQAHLLRLPDADPPAGWLGKAWACHQLSEQATHASVLVFIDADVTLAPTAIAAAVQTMRAHSLTIVCPYPRQMATTALQRLVQPLLQWSWATTLPLRLAERSPRPSLTAGNGQFLVVDRAAYDRAGGHAAVRAEVLEDIALVRQVKSVGGAGGVVDGTAIATCRMYDTDRDLIAGYTKSLWSAFGSPARAALLCALLALAYVSPVLWLALAAAHAVELSGLAMMGAGLSYAVGVANRALVDHRVGAPVGYALLHPVSIACLCWLVAISCIRRSRGELQWKGRVVV